MYNQRYQTLMKLVDRKCGVTFVHVNGVSTLGLFWRILRILLFRILSLYILLVASYYLVCVSFTILRLLIIISMHPLALLTPFCNVSSVKNYHDSDKIDAERSTFF